MDEVVHVIFDDWITKTRPKYASKPRDELMKILGTVIVNDVRDYVRGLSNAGAALEEPDLLPAQPQPDSDTTVMFEKVSTLLTPRQRRILELWLSDHSIPEMAAQLGATAKQIKQDRARIRGLIKRHFSPTFPQREK